MIKKIDGANAEIFKSWLQDNENTVLDVEGRQYLIQPLHNKIQKEIESDIELKMLIKQAKENIANGELYTTKEIIDAIENEEL